MRGGARGMARSSSRSSAATGCIIQEWKAWSACNRRQGIPSPASRRSNPATAAGGPATTDTAGALTAARESSGVSRARVSSSENGTASRAPGGSSPIRRARRDTRARASEKLHHAGQAGRHVLADAVPDDRLGHHAPAHPQPRQRVFDDEHRGLGVAGLGRSACAAVARRRLPEQLRLRSRPLAGPRVSPPARGEHHLPQVAAEVRQSSSAQRSTRRGRRARLVQPAAIPGYWLPTPGNRKTTERGPLPGRRSRPAAGRASAAPPRRRASPPAPRGGARRRGGPPAGCRRRRPGSGPCALAPAARRGRRHRVERGGRARREQQQLPGARRPEARRGGASSSTTCALVPPMPNELTPARRGAAAARPVASAGR